MGSLVNRNFQLSFSW